MFENGWWEDAYSSSYPSEFAPGHKLQRPSKESGIFQTLAPLVLFLFAKRQSQKGGGRAWHNSPATKYAPEGHI